MPDPTLRRSNQPNGSRSAKPALSPYLLEDVAMTRSDVLRARGECDSGSVDPALVKPFEWAVLAA